MMKDCRSNRLGVRLAIPRHHAAHLSAEVEDVEDVKR